jgi:hypothetical protein
MSNRPVSVFRQADLRSVVGQAVPDERVVPDWNVKLSATHQIALWVKQQRLDLLCKSLKFSP